MNGAYQEAAWGVIREVEKAVVGKDQVIEKIMTAILAGGHILVEDMPGTGKTTMALAFSTAMGLKEKRGQFTPDVLPSDLTGFTIYKKELEKFVYQPGAAMCNFLLADEINRTSPKTQSALLEVMEEGQVTVDGVTRKTGRPFIVMATENPAGSAGTQLLPDSQLDRFMICVTMGYPDKEDEIEILKRNQKGRPAVRTSNVFGPDILCKMQEEAADTYVHDLIYGYIADLVEATRSHGLISLGVSPRGAVALAAMSRARAWLKGRKYVVPEDVSEIFVDTAAHRIQLSAKARVGHVRPADLLRQIEEKVPAPSIRIRRG